MMATRSLELHGISLETLQAYLAALGGVCQPDGGILGPGWSAHLFPQPEYRIGRASFCSYLIEMWGDDHSVEEAWARLMLRVMRPGG